MKFGFLVFSVLLVCIGKAQEIHSFKVSDVTKLTFLNPGISYEKAIGEFETIYGQAFMNTSAYFSYSDALGSSAGVYFDPALTLQYRYYYNFRRREAKGKRTELNSLNYLSGMAESVFSKARLASEYLEEKKLRAINKIGIAWGMQRNYKKRFSLDLYIGPAYLFTRVTEPTASGGTRTRSFGKLTTIGQLNLGFWLNRR